MEIEVVKVAGMIEIINRFKLFRYQKQDCRAIKHKKILIVFGQHDTFWEQKTLVFISEVIEEITSEVKS